VPNFYAFYASLLDEKKDYPKGIKTLEKAVEKFKDNSQLKYYLGSLYDRVGRRDDSIDMMKKVLAVEPEHVQAMNFLAFSYAEKSQNLDDAEHMALRAMELQPNDGYILDTVGLVYFKKGETEEAIRYLEAAYKLKPDESIVAEHLGDAYYVFELSDKARDMYIKAMAVEKDEAKINYLRSKIVTMERGPQKNGGRVPASVGGTSH
jgi:tetratricopeptide (TPR) repeat protein